MDNLKSYDNFINEELGFKTAMAGVALGTASMKKPTSKIST